MAKTVECPGCGKTYEVGEEVIGKKVKCKKCDEQFVACLTEDLPEEEVDPPESECDASEEHRDATGSTEADGAKQRPPKRVGAIGCGIVLLIVILAVLSPGKRISQSTPADVSVYAGELTGDYYDNEVGADGKYKDKIVEISAGERDLIDIRKGITGGTYVILKPGRYVTVQCSFGKKNESQLASLRKYHTAITVKGRCAGKALGAVLLKDCVIMKIEQE